MYTELYAHDTSFLVYFLQWYVMKLNNTYGCVAFRLWFHLCAAGHEILRWRQRVINRFALNIVLYTVCNVGIIVFSSSYVLGNRESLLGNVLYILWRSFLVIKWCKKDRCYVGLSCGASLTTETKKAINLAIWVSGGGQTFCNFWKWRIVSKALMPTALA